MFDIQFHSLSLFSYAQLLTALPSGSVQRCSWSDGKGEISFGYICLRKDELKEALEMCAILPSNHGFQVYLDETL